MVPDGKKKSNYISVIALSLKMAAIGFYPDLSGLPLLMQYSSEGGQALTWLGFFWSIGIGRARVIFPAGSETPSLCIQKKSNYISVIALWLKTAAIGFYPALSGLPRCLAVLLRRRTSVDVVGLFPIYRNRKSSSDFSCRFWNLVLVYIKKEQLHFCNCSLIKNGGYRILSRFIGTPTLWLFRWYAPSDSGDMHPIWWLNY